MKREVNQIISLDDEQKKMIKEEIYAYFLDERDEELGIIAQDAILDLLYKNI